MIDRGEPVASNYVHCCVYKIPAGLPGDVGVPKKNVKGTYIHVQISIIIIILVRMLQIALQPLSVMPRWPFLGSNIKYQSTSMGQASAYPLRHDATGHQNAAKPLSGAGGRWNE